MKNKDASYSPPKVWRWTSASGGKFATINRPVAGSTHDSPLPIGRHPIQLYSLGTPNGVKVTILLEELLARGVGEADYDAHLIDIFKGDQFGKGFVEINPNSKIPALVDYGSSEPVKVFESGAILVYLADKFQNFLPSNSALRAECMSWVCWQMSCTPYFGGGFGHFFHYAPEKLEYAINIYANEVRFQFDILDRHLSANQYLCGSEYTIADIAIWPWYGAMFYENFYEAFDLLGIESCKHLHRWADDISNRDAVEKGRKVNRNWGVHPAEQVPERHEESDFVIE